MRERGFRPGEDYIHVHFLRQYLEYELTLGLPDHITVDSNRLIADYVLLTFLLGNDFLPAVPGLKIAEGALDLLLGLYRKFLVDSSAGTQFVLVLVAAYVCWC
jgi:5'-3' exonuclease